MVQAVGTYKPFRSSRLDLSVTTDHVMVAYAELPASLSVPAIDLSRRARLVRPHRRTVKDYQCNTPHDCIRNVDTKAVITVKIKFAILLIVSRFIKLKF